MKRTKKDYINIGIWIFASILALGGIIKGITAIVDWYEEIPHHFFLLDDTTKNKHYNNNDFPSDKPITYSMKNVPELVDTKDYLFYGKLENDDTNYHFVLAKKEEKQYTMLTGEEKGYSFKDPSFFHLTGPFQFKTDNGTIHIHFLDKKQYSNFIKNVEEAGNFRDIILYYKNKK